MQNERCDHAISGKEKKKWNRPRFSTEWNPSSIEIALDLLRSSKNNDVKTIRGLVRNLNWNSKDSTSSVAIVLRLDRARLTVRPRIEIRGPCVCARLNRSSVLEIVFTFICELDKGKSTSVAHKTKVKVDQSNRARLVDTTVLTVVHSNTVLGCCSVIVYDCLVVLGLCWTCSFDQKPQMKSADRTLMDDSRNIVLKNVYFLTGAKMAQLFSTLPWCKRSWVRFPDLAFLFRFLSFPCS